ncbi:hypothetical protein [Microvirga sp. VF16]|uniref:hypothetical protein n=1 Tax=Microvirga sp. VF16 TaxID=2807101 RepID=UPI00193E89A3|nr:hypothetical protein [Microvirga sp. VF16]QRM31378.1 hypothetical protein JO965_10540 [Microvirga sp. VF16]
MPRILSFAILASTAAFAIAPPAAWAVSPSQEQCEAQGGEFDRVNGEVICTEEGKNPKFTSATSGQGNIDNKTSGPVCDGTGSDKCPPGQF